MISLDSLLIPVHHKQVALFRLHDDMLAKTRHLHPGLTNEGGGGGIMLGVVMFKENHNSYNLVSSLRGRECV